MTRNATKLAYAEIASRPTEHTCPRCGGTYTGPPALSRTDGRTPICGGCGTTEALEDYIAIGPTPQTDWTHPPTETQ